MGDAYAGSTRVAKNAEETYIRGRRKGAAVAAQWMLMKRIELLLYPLYSVPEEHGSLVVNGRRG